MRQCVRCVHFYHGYVCQQLYAGQRRNWFASDDMSANILKKRNVAASRVSKMSQSMETKQY